MPKEIFTNNRIDYVINLIKPEKDDRVLNIGISNIPEIEMKIEEKVKENWVIDIDNNKLSKAKKYLKRTKVILGDINTYNFEEGYFDKIIALEVLEHLENDISVLIQINKILKTNGTLVVGVPSTNLLHIINPVKYVEHKRHYSKNLIKERLEKTRFKIVHFNYAENWSLLLNLYIHLFNKFVLRKTKPFNIIKSGNKTYLHYNKNGLDIIVKAVKV